MGLTHLPPQASPQPHIMKRQPRQKLLKKPAKQTSMMKKPAKQKSMMKKPARHEIPDRGITSRELTKLLAAWHAGERALEAKKKKANAAARAAEMVENKLKQTWWALQRQRRQDAVSSLLEYE